MLIWCLHMCDVHIRSCQENNTMTWSLQLPKCNKTSCKGRKSKHKQRHVLNFFWQEWGHPSSCQGIFSSYQHKKWEINNFIVADKLDLIQISYLFAAISLILQWMLDLCWGTNTPLYCNLPSLWLHHFLIRISNFVCVCVHQNLLTIFSTLNHFLDD